MKNPEKLLDLLSQDARLSTAQLAAMTGFSEDEVVSQLKHYEKNGTILGYKALVDWDKTDRESVTALIEVKITPQKGMGFDESTLSAPGRRAPPSSRASGRVKIALCKRITYSSPFYLSTTFSSPSSSRRWRTFSPPEPTSSSKSTRTTALNITPPKKIKERS